MTANVICWIFLGFMAFGAVCEYRDNAPKRARARERALRNDRLHVVAARQFAKERRFQAMPASVRKMKTDATRKRLVRRAKQAATWALQFDSDWTSAEIAGGLLLAARRVDARNSDLLYSEARKILLASTNEV